MNDWVAVLDRYEAALDRHEVLLRTGEPAPGALPWPPPEMPAGSLPVELLPRAQELLSRTSRLGRELAAARDSLPPLAPGHRPSARPSTPPAGTGRLDRAL